MQLAGPFHLIQAREFDFVERRARGFQMTLGEMQIDRSGFEVGVTEQQLHGR
jgi:hypothetical protein